MKSICCSIFILIALLLPADQVVNLDEVNKPDYIAVAKDYVYIAEGSQIYIYSRENFKFFKKIGKAGEGPQEFKVMAPFVKMQIFTLPDQFYVNSISKVSFFKANGDFIFEKKHGILNGMTQIYAAGDGFTALGFKQEKGKNFLTLDLYDANLKKIKVLKTYFVGKNRFTVFGSPFWLRTDKDKIYFAADKTFRIDVFNSQGKFLKIIEQKYQAKKFTASDKEAIFDWARTQPLMKDNIETLKKIWNFPDYYSAIRNFFVDGDKIYIQTFKVENSLTEFYILDLEGRLLKRVWLKINIKQPMQQFQLFDIFEQNLYQIVENEDDEIWELHVNEIK